MKKRLLSVLLALALLAALLPQAGLTARAAETGSCGANLTWTFDEASGTLTITGSGAMTDYDRAGNPDWQEIRKQVNTLVLPAGLTSIGSAAFARFYFTGSVVIPNGVTSIGGAAFYDCDMSSVTIPDSVKTIGDGAFCACDNLTEAFTFGGTFDFLGYEHLIAVRHQHGIAAGEGDFGGDAGAFGGDALFGDLHQDGLSGGKHVADLAVLFEGRLAGDCAEGALAAGDDAFHKFVEGKSVGAYVEIMEESVLVAADIDECCVEPRHNFADLSDVDITYAKLFGGFFLVKFNQPLVFKQRDLYLRRMFGDD